MPQTLSERFHRWRTNRCSERFNPSLIILPAFFVLGGSLYLIGYYVDFRYKFILYIILVCMFITLCSCIQNIHTRLDKLFRKCLRKIRAQDDDEVGDGLNTSRARSTPQAWSDGQDDNSSRQSGAYTVDHVYRLPSLGQMEDPPPQYADVIAAEPLPPSYEEATKT